MPPSLCEERHQVLLKGKLSEALLRLLILSELQVLETLVLGER